MKKALGTMAIALAAPFALGAHDQGERGSRRSMMQGDMAGMMSG